MAKFIKTIHDRVNFAIKKGLTGYIQPTKITDEVHAESMNLWRSYVNQFQKTKLMDVYTRPFQFSEIVQLNNGNGIYSNLDYVYFVEGIVPAGLTKTLISNVSYGVSSGNVLALSGTPGTMYWIQISTATAVPANVLIQLDGVTIFSGPVTNKATIIPFLYMGQISLTITVTGIGITLTVSSIVTTINDVECHIMDNDNYLYRLNHPVKAPTSTYPIALTANQYIQIAPANAFNFIILSYLRRPTKPLYAFTVSGDRYIYDDVNSIDFEWNESLHDIIMDKTLANLGINMRSPELVQFSNSQRKLDEQV